MVLRMISTGHGHVCMINDKVKRGSRWDIGGDASAITITDKKDEPDHILPTVQCYGEN